jgi:diguanylate cyclase (GGDEF)-like protein
VTADIAIALALVALAAGAFALRTCYAWRRSHDRLARSLIDTTARVATLARQLNDALDRLRQEARITVALGDIAASADLRDVLTRVAGAAAAATGARAAVARAVAADGTLVVGTTEEVTNLPVTAALEWPPEGARAMTFTMLRGPSSLTGSNIGSGLAVPIGEASAALGSVVALFDEHESAAEHMLGELERLAARVAPIVAAARASRSADESTTHHPLTGLATRRLFHECLAREVTRAQRHGTPLALLLLDVDDLRSMNERVGRRAADAALLTLVAAIQAVAPPSAVAYRIGGDEFALILPGSNRLDVELVLTRLHAEHPDREHADGPALTLSAGVAELMPGDDALRVFDRAARALQDAPAPTGDGLDETARDVDEHG